MSLNFNGSFGRIDVTQYSAINNLFNGGGSISIWIYAETYGESGEGKIM